MVALNSALGAVQKINFELDLAVFDIDNDNFYEVGADSNNLNFQNFPHFEHLDFQHFDFQHFRPEHANNLSLPSSARQIVFVEKIYF